MSKTQLKKEIQSLPREQLELMIIDAYEARKEIRQYFDYFLNPDVEKLTSRYKLEVSKEFSRSKRGYSKARITNIRRMYKELQGFHPGYDKEIEFLFHTLVTALACERMMNLNDTLIRGIAMLMQQMVELADRNLVADRLLGHLTALLDDEKAGTRYFRRFLREKLSEIRPS